MSQPSEFLLKGLEGSVSLFVSVICVFCCCQVLVIVDAKPKALGLPTDAYYAVEEVHDVSDPQCALF